MKSEQGLGPPAWASMFFLSFLLFSNAYAQPGGPSPSNRWAILITGISGDSELQTVFLGWMRDLQAALMGNLQFPREHIFVLFDEPEKDKALIQKASTRDNFKEVCAEIARKAKKDDLVFIFIAGHGNFDGKTYKLNLPGPDPTAEEMAAMIYGIPAERFVIVNTTTCSGASIAPLSHKGSIVVTATKSGHEKNQTHLGQFFVEALKGDAADTDKNGRVSVLEAYTYAVAKVEEYYNREGNLQTEHPVLEDNGDTEAHAKPGPDNGDGFLARTTYLDAGPARLAQGKLTPEQQALVKEAQELEKQIEALKYAKADMPTEEYEKKLEELLIKLATANAKLKKDK